MRTQQEIFNIVATHLRTQRSPAHVRGYCTYITPEGLRCAVGALLPANLTYEDSPEWMSLQEVCEEFSLPHHDLLLALRDVHDEVKRRATDGRFDEECLEAALAAVTDKFNLERNQP